jgi:hypothetical protein
VIAMMAFVLAVLRLSAARATAGIFLVDFRVCFEPEPWTKNRTCGLRESHGAPRVLKLRKEECVDDMNALLGYVPLSSPLPPSSL